ncbi:MAG: STAS domain-containing protein [Mycobacterium sp.]
MSVIDQNELRSAAGAKAGAISLFSSVDETARFTAQWRRPSTVLVTASGEIDAVNAGHLAEYATSHLEGHRNLILDLQGLQFFGTDGLAALNEIQRHCAGEGVDWLVVPSKAVTRLLDISGGRNFPLGNSVPGLWNKLA